MESNEFTTEDLRKSAKCIYIAVEEPVAHDISAKLKWAADHIEALEKRIEDLKPFLSNKIKTSECAIEISEKEWAEKRIKTLEKRIEDLEYLEKYSDLSY